MAASRINRTERLLNLVFALMTGRRAVTRSQIRQAIPGYRETPSDSAFERMFERDKDELRGMGIPITTVLDAHGDVEGYQIDTDQYQMPDLAFSAEELSVLTLAASVWDESVIGPSAKTALRKVEAIQGAAASQPRVDSLVSVRWSETNAAILPFFSAVRQGRVVTFDYRSGNAPVAVKRSVDPWAVVANGGYWYAVGHDNDRDATRVFRLSRVAGTVQVTAREQSHPMPTGTDIRSLVNSHAPDAPFEARVTVLSGQAAELRRIQSIDPRADVHATTEILIRASSVEHMVSLICAAGSGAIVESPDQIRSDVKASLQRIRDTHSEPLSEPLSQSLTGPT